jgi:hypothetical protein
VLVLVLVLVLPAFSPKAVPSIVELFIKFHQSPQTRSIDLVILEVVVSIPSHFCFARRQECRGGTSALVLRQLAFDHRRRQLGGFQSEHQAQLPRM